MPPLQWTPFPRRGSEAQEPATAPDLTGLYSRLDRLAAALERLVEAAPTPEPAPIPAPEHVTSDGPTATALLDRIAEATGLNRGTIRQDLRRLPCFEPLRNVANNKCPGSQHCRGGCEHITHYLPVLSVLAGRNAAGVTLYTRLRAVR